MTTRCISARRNHLVKPLSLLTAAAFALAAIPAQAQTSPTMQRLRQLEAEKQAADAVEAAKWRTFPKSVPRNALTKTPSILLPNSFPFCSYYWQGWRLDPATGIRSTIEKCSSHPGFLAGSYANKKRRIGVKCSSLQIARTFGSLGSGRWMGWRLPSTDGEKEMVVALCDSFVEP